MISLKNAKTLFLLPLLSLSSCKDEASGETGTTGSEAAKAATKSRPSMKEMMKTSREIAAHKKKVNYEEPARVKELGEEEYRLFQEIQRLKKEHPEIIALDKESAEANSKLLEAVKNQDEEGKAKWGREVGGFVQKKMAIVAQIPEITELEAKKRTLEAERQKLEVEALRATPGGDELADKLQDLFDAGNPQ